MERRQEPRNPADHSVIIRTLEDGKPAQRAIVRDESGRGMRLELDRPLAVGGAVEIQIGDRLLLAEVCYSERSGAVWRVGVEIEQCLRDSKDLLLLRQALDAWAGNRVSRGVDGTMESTFHGVRKTRPEENGQPPPHRFPDEGEPARIGAPDPGALATD